MPLPRLPARSGSIQNHWSQTSDDLSTLCSARGMEPSGLKKDEKIVLLGLYDLNAPEEVVEQWGQKIATLTTLKFMGEFAQEHGITLSNPTSRPASLNDIIMGLIEKDRPRDITDVEQPQDTRPATPSTPFTQRGVQLPKGTTAAAGPATSAAARHWATSPESIFKLGRTPFFTPVRSAAPAARSTSDDIQSVMDNLSLGTHDINHETRDEVLRQITALLQSDPARARARAPADTAWSDAVDGLGECALEQAQVIQGVQSIGASQRVLAEQMRRNIEKLQLLHTIVDQVAQDTRDLVGAMEATATRSIELADDVERQGATLQNRAERRYRDAKALLAKLWKR